MGDEYLVYHECFWHLGRVNGKGIDLHDFGIKKFVDFCDFIKQEINGLFFDKN